MKRAKQHPPASLKPRNPVVRSPLLGKGGVHEKSRSAKRQQERRELAKLVRDLPDE